MNLPNITKEEIFNLLNKGRRAWINIDYIYENYLNGNEDVEQTNLMYDHVLKIVKKHIEELEKEGLVKTRIGSARGGYSPQVRAIYQKPA